MHVEPKPQKDYPWFIQPFFWSQKRRYGKVLQPGLLWARIPLVFMPLALLYGALDRRSSKISPALRSLVTVRVSQINHCAFCVDINSATLMKRGITEEKVSLLPEWKSNPMFSPSEKAALAYTEAMTITGTKPEDMPVAELRKYFDDDSIVELTAVVAFQNMSSKFNSALDVPPQGFCRIPKKIG